MTNNAKATLRCNNGELFVALAIDFAGPTDRFSFYINALLQIDAVSSDAECKISQTREWTPAFAPLSREYLVSFSAPSRKLSISYHGRICGFANIINPDKLALNEFSAWFPQESDAPLEMLILLLGMEDYFVLHARYDAQSRTWVYGEQGYDAGNIIAMKRGTYRVAQAENFSFYYFDASEASVADHLIRYYKDIIPYYNTAFGKRELNQLDVVSLGMGSSGAFFRKELIVAEHIAENAEDNEATRLSIASLLAHELAHNWFTGADPYSWEDWLNETGATWASLLYALERDDDALFSYILDWRKDSYMETPAIKTPNGSRPDSGIHERGTMLFYELYRKYGKEVVLTILRCFLELECKTTERLLAALEQKIGPAVPGMISEALSAQSYDC